MGAYQGDLEQDILVEDEMNKNTRVNLMSGGQISRTTGLAAIGIDYEQEQRKIAKETIDQADRESAIQAKLQQKGAYGEALNMPPPGVMQAQGYMQNALAEQQQAMAPQEAPGAAGPMPPPSAGAPAAGGAPAEPGELIQQAQDIANQLFSAPYGVRRSELQKIKSTNETLHALVKQALEQMRTQAASQGVQQARGGM